MNISEEMVDVLDDSGNVVKTIARSEAEQNNHLTSNVLVFIFNSRGEVWVQLRPMNKKHYPGRWDISACGGIESGEAHEVAAARETQEETGLTPELHYAGSFFNVFPGDDGEIRRRFSYLYIGTTDETPKPGDDADEFICWNVGKLREDLRVNPSHYVPSFGIELEKAIERL